MRNVLCLALALTLALAGCLDDAEKAERTGSAAVGGAGAEGGAEVFEVGSVEVSESYLLGTWATKSCSGTIYTTFHDDGSYTGRMVRNNGRVARTIEGTWELSDGKLIWVHQIDTSRTKRGQQDINPFVHADEDSFTVKETNGRRTRFRRAI